MFHNDVELKMKNVLQLPESSGNVILRLLLLGI